MITGAHSSLSTAVCRRLLTFISRRSFSTSSTYIILGLPLLPLPSGLFSNIFLTVLTCSIFIACPIHSNLFFLISVTTSRSLYNSPSYSLVLILQFLVLPLFQYHPCYFPLPRTQPFHIHRSHSPRFIPACYN